MIKTRPKEWFQIFQPLLLQIANTHEGRALLCIQDKPYKIWKMTPNSIHYALPDGQAWADFRTHDKWAKVIKHRWPDFKKVAKSFYEKEYNGQRVLVPILNVQGQLVAAHATDTFLLESADQGGDGGLYQNFQAGGWDAIHDKTTCSTDESTSTLGRMACVGWYSPTLVHFLGRGYFPFDTSTLGASATVTAATFSYYQPSAGEVGYFDANGQDPSLVIALVQSTQADPTDLVVNDFDNWVALDDPAEGANRLTVSTSTNDQYNDFAMNATGLGWIETEDWTLLGMREAEYDCEDDNYNIHGLGNDCHVKSRWSEYTGTSADPKLAITYTLPSSASSKLTLLGVS